VTRRSGKARALARWQDMDRADRLLREIGGAPARTPAPQMPAPLPPDVARIDAALQEAARLGHDMRLQPRLTAHERALWLGHCRRCCARLHVGRESGAPAGGAHYSICRGEP